MKNLLLLFLLAWSTNQVISQAVGTTIVGGCSTVIVTSVPQYPHDVFIFPPLGGYFRPTNNPCVSLVNPCLPESSNETRHWLQLKQLNGSFINIQGPVEGDGAVFSTVAHGTYRVYTQIPEYENFPNCENGRKEILCQANLVHMGWNGHYGNPGVYSNEVQVGIVVPSDIAYNFVDGSGGDNIPNGFDYGELVRMDASASKNYNAWWLAIFELGGQQRYKANGWTPGQVGTINLTEFWKKNTPQWEFESLNSYLVQFAIVNEQCQIQGQWTNLDKAFFICPTGSGCKFEKPENSISIYPNPVNSQFRFTGIDFTPVNKFEYELRSLEGKLIQKQIIVDPSTNYSIDGVQSGIYLISLFKDDQRVFNTKLSLIK
ncbi:MAG: T9SS type A sorting domain-containing protein [Saprospiraceae bacterium]|nr:T9SS type A sorting domain-containing protein [Candidatus Defluviibacterium haderslevense]